MKVIKYLLRVTCTAALLVLVSPASPSMTEDGYDLWLRYKPLGSRAQEA